MYISQDMIRREMLWVKDGENTLAIPLFKRTINIRKQKNSNVVILEGIMYADWYKSLFELARELYRENIYAYYFDIPFEETVKRHQTRAESEEFGEEALRRWWREKDYSDVLVENAITAERDQAGIVQEIYNTVMEGLE